jgi:tetratricopeptide (TPR) repeat protein
MLADGPRDLTTALRTLINNDDMQGAAEALLAAHETGETVLGRSIALRDAIAGVQLPRITPQVAVAFALARCELAARTRQYTAAAADAAFVLERNGARNDEERRLLQMITALADHERGEHESALLQFRRFADDESLSTLERAWAWNNIATFLPLENAECERAACQASDLFLVAGRKIDAARCLVRAARSRLATSPPTAAGFLDQALGWIGEDEDGLEQLVRGGMLQNRARVNMMLGRHDKALKDALASWAELRGLIGSEQVIPTSLAIAVEATQELGEDTSDLLRELDAARRRAEPERHAVRTEILQLLGEFDEVAFRRVSTHPLLSSDASLRAQLLIANALGPPDIPDVERIARMERARNAATESGDRETVTIVLLALAKLLAGFHQAEPSPQISPKAAGKIAWRRISASNAVISSTRRSSRMFGSAS